MIKITTDLGVIWCDPVKRFVVWVTDPGDPGEYVEIEAGDLVVGNKLVKYGTVIHLEQEPDA